jgi:hypothetical protein
MFRVFISQYNNLKFLNPTKSYSNIVLNEFQKNLVDSLYNGILKNKRADLAKSITLGNL